jgi:hypothetical protein
MVSSQPNLFLAPQLLDDLTETQDDVVAALLLFLKPAFMPCMFLAGHDQLLSPSPKVAAFPSGACNLFDLMPEPPTDVVLLPLHQARRHDDLKPNQSCYHV